MHVNVFYANTLKENIHILCFFCVILFSNLNRYTNTPFENSCKRSLTRQTSHPCVRPSEFKSRLCDEGAGLGINEGSLQLV